MNKKVKKLVVAVALIGGLSVGARAALGAADTNSHLDANDIIRLTTENDSDLNLFRKRIKVKEKWYDEKTEKKDSDDNFLEDMKDDIIPLRERYAIKELEWEREKTQDRVVTESLNSYYKIMIHKKTIQVQEKTIKRLGKLLEYKKAKIKAGTEAAVTLIDDETNLKSAQVKLQQLKNDEEKMMMELNMNIGTPVDKKLNLKEVEVPYEIFEVKNIENVVEKMLSKYHTIKAIEEEKDIDEREKALNHVYDNADDKSETEKAMNPSRDYEENEAKLEDHIVELKYKLQDEKKDIEGKIRIDYNSILNLQSDVEARKLDLEKAKTLLNTEKKKFEVGRSTQIQCDAAEENLLMAECQYNMAKLNHYIAVENFKNFTRRAR